ncbi:MAG: hypothetical protein DRQ89_12830 [Epsilonproteobacteria bacterium]|nr:MAG: hypothetical protein DRQ89_12830 [Campylobacterota bacterium]
MKIKRITTVEGLDALKESWIQLENIKGNSTIFQSWNWNRIWCEQLIDNGRGWYLNVRVVEDNHGQVLAILPFCEQHLLLHALKITHYLGHHMSYGNDILLADANSPELAREVVNLTLNDLDSRTIIHLRHLNSNSLFTKELLDRGLAYTHCPRVLIRADSNITDQSTRLGRSRRKSFRLAENRLKRKGNIKYRICAGEDFPDAFEEMIRLHKLRFASQGRATMLEDENLIFLRLAASKLSEEKLSEIIELRLGDKILASALMARYEDRYYFIQGGFDPDYSRFSPMRLLLTETMRRGFDELNCGVYDTGPGYEKYKYDWKHFVDTNYFACSSGPGLYAKLLARIYHILFLKNLPPIP